MFVSCTLSVVSHVEQVLAIELLGACQGMEFIHRKGLHATEPLEKVYHLVRQHVKYVCTVSTKTQRKLKLIFSCVGHGTKIASWLLTLKLLPNSSRREWYVHFSTLLTLYCTFTPPPNTTRCGKWLSHTSGTTRSKKKRDCFSSERVAEQHITA